MSIIRISCKNETEISLLKESAIAMGFLIQNDPLSNTSFRIKSIGEKDEAMLDEWIRSNLASSLETNPNIMVLRNKQHTAIKPYFTKNAIHRTDLTQIKPNAAQSLSYFTAVQFATIYGFTPPVANVVNVIGIISLGGGLFGTVDASGILTNGDVQTYWGSVGINPSSYPVVKVVLIDNATNSPVLNDGATIENTIDVEMSGVCCASASTVIILYIAPNTDLGFFDCVNTALNTPINVNGQMVKPNTISISWGAPEIAYTPSLLNNLNTLFASAVSAGINIFVASGDNGSSDGIRGSLNVDYPSSSPNVIGCGGTNLVCPNLIYDASTIETVWTGTGGGFSKIFTLPSYQSGLNLTQNYRAVPDIAGDADPNTGVVFRIGGSSYIIGGTSIVAPAYAGFIASLNINFFILPYIYTYGSTSFHDVRVGNNGGYTAKVGYDNNTGLGSLNGSVIAPLLISHTIIPPPPIIHVASITLNVSTLVLNPSQTSQLVPSILPANSSNQNINWTSSNTSGATVSNSGVITAIANGSATITATTVDQAKSAYVFVTVITPVSSISLNVSSLVLNPLQTSQLVPSILPATASNKNVNWISSNTSVATVSNTGIITAIANGSATITTTTVDQAKSASVSVSVIAATYSISLNVSSLVLNPTQTSQLVPTVLPTNAPNKNVNWSSSNTSVATVSGSGLIQAVANGNAIIRATTVVQSKTANVSITVLTPVTSLILTPTNIRIQLNRNGQITPTISPPTASNKVVLWSSSNTRICTVNASGLIRGVNRGTTIVTARTVDGNITATVNVVIY